MKEAKLTEKIKMEITDKNFWKKTTLQRRITEKLEASSQLFRNVSRCDFFPHVRHKFGLKFAVCWSK